MDGFWLMDGEVAPRDMGPTFTNEKRNLRVTVSQGDSHIAPRLATYRKFPSVRTLRSWRMNQMPILSWGAVRRKALAARLPMRFRVNMPCGWAAPPSGSLCARLRGS